jgi:uncharacterized protein YdhG (YjbR/CyaY superfamily)
LKARRLRYQLSNAKTSALISTPRDRMSSRPAFASVPDYLSSLEPAHSKALKSVLALVRKTVPKGEQVISYGIPAFRLGRVFIYCAAFKRHIGIYPPVRGDAKLAKDLKPYANAKGNLSFPLDAPMPMALIARVAKALAKQYAQPIAPKTKRKRPKAAARAT